MEIVYLLIDVTLADDGDKRISNDWRVGDQAMCKTDNLISRTTNRTANRYYWRLRVNKGNGNYQW